MLAKSTFVVIPETTPTRRPHHISPNVSPRPGASPLEQSERDKMVKEQLDIVRATVHAAPRGCIEEVTVDDLNNAIFTMINRTTGKSNEVTLMIPANIERGEFALWTRDGHYELGISHSPFHLSLSLSLHSC